MVDPFGIKVVPRSHSIRPLTNRVFCFCGNYIMKTGNIDDGIRRNDDGKGNLDADQV
mgnify:CR=1 FL=1